MSGGVCLLGTSSSFVASGASSAGCFFAPAAQASCGVPCRRAGGGGGGGGLTSPLSSSPPTCQPSPLHSRKHSQHSSPVAAHATKEFVGVVVRGRAKPRGRRGQGGDDGGDEDDYFEEGDLPAFGGDDGFFSNNGSGSGGYNWWGPNNGGGDDEGSSGWDGDEGGSAQQLCMAVYSQLWQLACLGSCAQAVRFLALCILAARAEQTASSPGSG